ncbi:hypothetical protein RJ639_016131 [Escallonia herrerae]|uniref:Uncharacterized protein n=1 Tax=Escallonia herrerae TaxID=1293975 RepID=A0AA88VAZ4_9ASTE|nr:hypothetical protein RJ639_016131 [Escallonia herrerae]
MGYVVTTNVIARTKSHRAFLTFVYQQYLSARWFLAIEQVPKSQMPNIPKHQSPARMTIAAALASKPVVGASMKIMEGLATSSTAIVSRLRCSVDRPKPVCKRLLFKREKTGTFSRTVPDRKYRGALRNTDKLKMPKKPNRKLLKEHQSYAIGSLPSRLDDTTDIINDANIGLL